MSKLLVGRVYSGEEFNERIKNKKLVKLTTESEIHNNFQFSTGLNIDPIPFNPKKECLPGGFYFCDYDKFNLYLEYGNKRCVNMRIVTIPDDATVYVELFKYKADKFILSQPIKIFEHRSNEFEDNELCLELIRQTDSALKYIKYQTEELCLVAVKKNGFALRFVNIQTNEICLEAVKENGLALEYVENQTEEICSVAIKQNPKSKRYLCM